MPRLLTKVSWLFFLFFRLAVKVRVDFFYRRVANSILGYYCKNQLLPKGTQDFRFIKNTSETFKFKPNSILILDLTHIQLQYQIEIQIFPPFSKRFQKVPKPSKM